MTADRVDRLTKRTLDALEATGARYTVWDGELKGFGVRIEASGRKTFVVRYRAEGGGRRAPLRQVKELHAVDDQGKSKFRPQEISTIEAAEEQVRQQKLTNAAAERDKAIADARENQEKALQKLNQDLLQSQDGLARTTEERRQLALQLLALARADEWSQREAQLKKTPNVTSADIDAQKRLFDQGTALQRQSTLRANQSPLDSYRDNIQLQSGAGRTDHAETEAVEDFSKLDDALVQVETGATTVGKALTGIGTSIEQQLLHDLNQQFIVAPLTKTVDGFIQKAFPAVADTGATTAMQALAQSASRRSGFRSSSASSISAISARKTPSLMAASLTVAAGRSSTRQAASVAWREASSE